MTDRKSFVPELRFPEFEGEWEQKRLGDIADFSKGKGISKSDIVEDGVTPCIRYGELYTTYGTEIDEPQSSTDISLDKLYLSQGGEVIVPASGEDSKDIATASSVVRSGIALGGDLNVIRGSFDPKFLVNMLSGKKRLALAALAQGNSVVHLYPSQIAKLRVELPKLTEQRKIADFLSAVDTKITLLGEKKVALEEFKRGMMQQLFAQKLRFTSTDGSAFPDWKEKKLGDIGELSGGGTPESGISKYWDGNIIWFTPSEIKTKYLSESARKITELGVRNSSAKLLPAGALVLSTRATIGEVGIATRQCTTNQGFQSIVVNRDQHNEYWYYWIIQHRGELRRRAAGSTFPEIKKTEVANVPVLVPHIEEQRKIADFLSAVDTKITLLADKKTALEAFRKGLLQKMFV